jgi:hypothetical protein
MAKSATPAPKFDGLHTFTLQGNVHNYFCEVRNETEKAYLLRVAQLIKPPTTNLMGTFMGFIWIPKKALRKVEGTGFFLLATWFGNMAYHDNTQYHYTQWYHDRLERLAK